MAFVRRRTTANGTLVTTLMESYRDAEGRPRQRTLANLHGADSADQALARLSAVRARLEKLAAAVAAEARSVERAAAAFAGRSDAQLPWEDRIERAALENRGRWLGERAAQLTAALESLAADCDRLAPHRTWDDKRMKRAEAREGQALDKATKTAVGERLAAKSLERRKAVSDGRLRQLGAAALLDEHSLIESAKALGVLPEGDLPRE